jgi:hypothetical protein
MEPAEKPKLQVDQDWKAQAQAEKERLARQEQEKKQKPAGTANAAGMAGELPPADFRSLIGMLASQAVMGLGAVGDPKTGRVVIDLEGAKFAIDLLGMLEEKTKGNLAAEEASELQQVLAELRARFVQIAQLVARQAGMPQAAAAGVVGAERPLVE